MILHLPSRNNQEGGSGGGGIEDGGLDVEVGAYRVGHRSERRLTKSTCKDDNM